MSSPTTIHERAWQTSTEERVQRTLWLFTITLVYDRRNEKPMKDKFKETDSLKELEKQIEAGVAHTGQAIADIFTYLSKVGAKLPNMELHTNQMCLVVTDAGMSVKIMLPNRIAGDSFFGEAKPDEDEDEEEGLLYDGD